MEEYIQKWQELKQEAKKMELKLFDALLIEEDLLCYGTMRLMNNVEGGKHITAYYRPALQRAGSSSREDVYYLLVMP